MTDIAKNLSSLLTQLPSSVKLVAVSKTRPVSEILVAYKAGQRYFGENKVQELLSKKDLLPPDIDWHLIGHLQSNKVKFIVPFISMIQSVDTYRLLTTINSEALKIGRVVDCLLQIHIATEETKFGFSLNEISEMIGSQAFMNMKNINVCGVMGMATFTSDTIQIRKEFVCLADSFNFLKNRYFSGNPCFKEISMGMSDDYKTAIQEGCTIVRIGSIVFGERN